MTVRIQCMRKRRERLLPITSNPGRAQTLEKVGNKRVVRRPGKKEQSGAKSRRGSETEPVSLENQLGSERTPQSVVTRVGHLSTDRLGRGSNSLEFSALRVKTSEAQPSPVFPLPLTHANMIQNLPHPDPQVCTDCPNY